MATDMGFAGYGGALYAIIGIWSFVGLGVYVWYLWSLARLFPYLGMPAAHGWIPVWNQWRLIERGGLPGWIAILGIVPGLSLVAVVISIIAIHRINQEHEEGTGMTVLGALVPPLWATMLGSRLRDRGYAAVASDPGAWRPAGAGLVEYGPDGQVYPLLPSSAPQPAGQQQFSMPPVPPQFGATPAQPTYSGEPAAPAGPAHTPAAHPASTPLNPGAAPAPPRGAVPPAPPASPAPPAQVSPGLGAPNSNPWGLGNTTEGNFQRLANEQLPSRDASFGGGVDARPFSWPEPAPIPPSSPRQQPVSGDGSALNPAVPGAGAPLASVASDGDDAWRPSVEAVAAARGADNVEPETASAIPDVVAETRVTASDVAPVLPPLAPPVHPSVQGPITGAILQAEEPAQLHEQAPPAVEPVAVPVPDPTVVPEPEEPAAVPTPVAAPVDPVPATAGEPASVAADPVAALFAAPSETPVTPAAVPTELDDELDQTVVVSRRAHWVLVLPDGQKLALEADDVVVGRKPVAVGGSEVLVVPDATRTLSKSHARLRLDANGWTIEDLNSTNGVFTIDAAGVHQELAPGVPTPATEDLIIGTLEVRLTVVD